MTEIEREITIKAGEACKEHDGSANYRYGFYDGAKWMHERIIKQSEEWLKEEMHYRDHSSGRGSWGKIEALGAYDSLEEFIEDFKQAMKV